MSLQHHAIAFDKISCSWIILSATRTQVQTICNVSGHLQSSAHHFRHRDIWNSVLMLPNVHISHVHQNHMRHRRTRPRFYETLRKRVDAILSFKTQTRGGLRFAIVLVLTHLSICCQSTQSIQPCRYLYAHYGHLHRGPHHQSERVPIPQRVEYGRVWVVDGIIQSICTCI
ncbi:hypothetical protein LX32DRAFT_25745 [Colletotrichum zoysiae]|uniref:Uncharacterized protein n=1 Tax=Colletotrichum zoysiae TaxID=1216348 RepID=A0AAD9HRS2_9PEZI|nr:hypothetical protein LX32DRAFT_25745 [Colletotrichum zoysiae]